MANTKSFSGPLVVILLLVALPAVSWFYLRKGFEYRKAGILTQEDHGPMPDLKEYPAIVGSLPAEARGSMHVVGWLDPAETTATATYGTMLDSLYQQFAASPNLYFTTIVLDRDAPGAVREFTERYHLPEDEMLSFLQTDTPGFARSATAFSLPLAPASAPGSEPIVALVDSSLTIVKHYNLNNRDETLGLVELISLIIPLPERQDIILDRGKEL